MYVLEISSSPERSIPIEDNPGHVEEGDPFVVGVQEVDKNNGGQETHEEKQTHPESFKQISGNACIIQGPLHISR